MEFRFDVRPLFNHPIVKINSNMLPIGFRGDRRMALDTATKVAEIVNEMGAASARAQGLSNPVTTAQKLRMADQNVYLLCDPNQGRNGSVIGLLKVGKKSLYVFDQNGQTQMVNAPCVLDFYVHESRQRAGLGKDLFDTMLQQEEFVPQKLAVDRPSDKLLGFLHKHYGLQKTIPQMNNFVVYDGFFEKPNQETNVTNHDGRMHITASPNTALFGPQFINEEQAKRAKAQQAASNTSIPLIQSSPVGRYAAPRPMGSMAEIIHNTATTAIGEPKSNSHEPSASEPYHDTVINDTVNVNTINVNIENLQLSEHEDNAEDDGQNANDDKRSEENHQNNMSNGHHHQVHHQQQQQHHDHHHPHHRVVKMDPIEHFIEEQILEPLHIQKPSGFPLSKQHTGMKNISYNVSMAVSPTDQIDFVHKSPESPVEARIIRPLDDKAAGMPSHENTDDAAISPGSGAPYTGQGYYDLKFYHNKLW